MIKGLRANYSNKFYGIDEDGFIYIRDEKRLVDVASKEQPNSRCNFLTKTELEGLRIKNIDKFFMCREKILLIQQTLNI